MKEVEDPRRIYIDLLRQGSCLENYKSYKPIGMYKMGNSWDLENIELYQAAHLHFLFFYMVD